MGFSSQMNRLARRFETTTEGRAGSGVADLLSLNVSSLDDRPPFVDLGLLKGCESFQLGLEVPGKLLILADELGSGHNRTGRLALQLIRRRAELGQR
jgi:hypothetical protein